MTTLAALRWSALLLVAVSLAGCGGASKRSAPATSAVAAAVPKPGPGQVLYRGGSWAVVLQGGRARALHLERGAWRADTSRAVKVAILGPRTPAASTPQVAVELSAGAPLVESGLWVDGRELLAKGGGLSPTRGTIYGAPARPLGAGAHVAVAYGRTSAHATAVSWSFRVP